MLAYFLKINVAIALFYAFYRLFFYKDTFFTWRRAALLCFFAVSAVYPLLNIQTCSNGRLVRRHYLAGNYSYTRTSHCRLENSSAPNGRFRLLGSSVLINNPPPHTAHWHYPAIFPLSENANR